MPADPELYAFAREVANVRQAQRDYFAVSARKGKLHPEATELCEVSKAAERKLDRRLKELLDQAAPRLFGDPVGPSIREQQLPD